MIRTEAGVALEGLEVRGDPVRYRVTYDQSDVSPSAAVVAAIATVTDADPTEMRPLYDSVDPDALDTVLEASSGQQRPISVTIDVGEYEIEISNDGIVDIDPPGTPSLDGRRDVTSLE